MDNKKSILIMVVDVVSVFVLVLLSALVVGMIAGSEEFNCNETIATYNETTLFNYDTTLTPVEYGIISSNINSNNNTWINCSVDDYMTSTTTEDKTTISLWFSNETTDWTSLISSNNSIYIDGVIDDAWTFLPYFITGDDIIFCKSDVDTFLNVSIDEIRVYSKELNTTEISEVISYGR